MRSDRPSRTAEYMALFRALETCRPGRIRLFEDPYALALLSGRLRVVARVGCLPGVGRVVPWVIDVGWPLTRSSGVIRTRVIDDAVSAALGEGVTQMVLLGAGLDSRPYRLPGARAVTVFEVDHPATQRAKCDRLAAVLGALPGNVRYLPVDFERDDLQAALERAGFDAARRAIIVWEGVVSYLSAASVDRNFALLARFTAAGSRLIFTYVHHGALDGSVHFAEAARWRGWVRFSGEPFVFGFEPAELPGYLAARGFRLVSDETTAAAAERVSRARRRREPGSQLYRVALADRV